MTRSRLLFVLLLTLPAACISSGKEQDPSAKVIITHHENGKVKAIVALRDGKRHGIARSYYRNGQLWQEVNYYNGEKHGIAKTYFDTGYLYQESEYSEGKLHGIRKRYRRNGQLMAEVPYHYNKPAAGLKEYLLDTREKNVYPGPSWPIL